MANIFHIILLCAIISQCSGQCNLEKAKYVLKKSLYDFSIDLVTRISEETENHFVSSPMSIWTLISPLTTVSQGETRSEINHVLNIKPNKCFTEKFYAIIKTITESNSGSSDGTFLERCSTIYVDQDLVVKPDFEAKFRSSGVTEAKIVKFTDFDNAANIINDNVRKVTHGFISNVVSASDLEGVYLTLIDAVYFQGTWEIPFPVENTETSAFYDDDEKQIGDVSLMFVMDKFNVANIDTIGAKVVDIPYTNGERGNNKFSMLIFLPQRGVSLTNLILNLKSISLNAVFNSYKHRYADIVSLQIPKFKISSDLSNMKELLVDMGLKTMFDSSFAQFPGISDYSLYISNLVQKAHVQVDEKGTVASAASAAEFESRMLPEDFVANKPFLYMIVEKNMQIPIFIGAYSKPSVFQDDDQ